MGWIIIPFFPLVSISECIKGYCEAFYIKKSFAFVPLFNTPIFLLTLWYFTKNTHLGVMEVVYSKIIFITVDFAGNITVAYYYKKFAKFESLQCHSKFPKEFLNFGIEVMKNFQIQIFNFVGLLFCTILALLCDHTRGQISFFYWMNIQSFFYAIGFGYSQVIKRRMTFLISKKEEFEAARNFFFWFFRKAFVVYFIVGANIVILRYQIGYLFATTDLIEEQLSYKIGLGCFVYISHIFNLSLFETMKIIDKDWVLQVVRVAIFLPIIGFLGIYFAYATHYGVKGICFVYCFCEFVVVYSCTIFLIVYNWKYAFLDGDGPKVLKGSFEST